VSATAADQQVVEPDRPGERYRLRTPPGIRITTSHLEPGEAQALAAALHEITRPADTTYAG